MDHDWCDNNPLTFNLKKCKAIEFTTNRKTSDNGINIWIGNTPIETVTECKYLSIISDNHLKLSAHLNMLKRKFKAMIYTVKNSD